VLETRTRDADRQREIDAVWTFLLAKPEQWPELVPQMLSAVGAAHLSEVVETVRRRVGRFVAVADSPEGLVIVGHHARVLVWALLDEQGELTNLLIGGHGPRRLISRAGRVRLAGTALLTATGVYVYVAWTATTADLCVLAAITPAIWWVLLKVGAPAAQPWWVRCAVDIGALAALSALFRAPGLPVDDNPRIGGVGGLVLVGWWICRCGGAGTSLTVGPPRR
jgi:hypothetical protein